jgi:hypothetical protein
LIPQLEVELLQFQWQEQEMITDLLSLFHLQILVMTKSLFVLKIMARFTCSVIPVQAALQELDTKCFWTHRDKKRRGHSIGK